MKKTAWGVASILLCIASLALATGGAWMSEGPGPVQGGGTEGITNGLVIGAIHALAPHPSDPDTLYIGATNGGIWKTTNATAANPTWTPLTDDKSSLSIGALAFDPTDGTNQTLVAGIGRTSSLLGTGGPRTGLLRTVDGGRPGPSSARSPGRTSRASHRAARRSSSRRTTRTATTAPTSASFAARTRARASRIRLRAWRSTWRATRAARARSTPA